MRPERIASAVPPHPRGYFKTLVATSHPRARFDEEVDDVLGHVREVVTQVLVRLRPVDICAIDEVAPVLAVVQSLLDESECFAADMRSAISREKSVVWVEFVAGLSQLESASRGADLAKAGRFN
jgi:hypothetical protein